MAQKITIDEYKGMSDSAKAKVANDDLAALAKSEKVSLETDDNKADMIAKLDKHIASSSGDNGGDNGEGNDMKTGASGEGVSVDPATGSPETNGDLGNANSADPGTATSVAPGDVPEAATQTVGSGWGSPPASGNGAHTADTVPPAPAVGGSPVEGDGPGQGRVMAPNADVHPADAPVAAAPQANAGTPEHHDASAAGQGPGGTTLDPDVAKATGAAIADPDARPSPGDEYVNDLARHEAGGFNSPSHIGNTEADEGEAAYAIGNSPEPSLSDMLRTSHEITATIAAQKAPPVNPDAPKPTFGEGGQTFEVQPGANEKITDAIGSTHDAGGNEVAKGATGPGLPVYVGTAQPVEQPDAQWRANTGA